MKIEFSTAMSLIGAFIENPLIRKFLIHLAESTETPEVMGTEIDNWIIRIIYGSEAIEKSCRKEVVASAIEEIQEQYNIAKEEAAAGDSTRLDTLKAPVKLDFDMQEPTWPPEINYSPA